MIAKPPHRRGCVSLLVTLKGPTVPGTDIFTRMRTLHGCVLFLSAAHVLASDLRIDSVQWTRRAGAPDLAHLHISWNNAWHNDRNHDAVWIHLRYTGNGEMRPFSLPALIADDGHTVVGTGNAPNLKVERDQVGVWILPPKGHRGSISCSVALLLEDEGKYDQVPGMDQRRLTAHGIEMVMIPSGAFHVGDPDPRAIANGAFFTAPEAGGIELPFLIREEKRPIPVGGAADLAYTIDEHGYRGDGAGPIPAEFPKGVAAFHIMKYELRQGQYADFLNDISQDATFIRGNMAGREYQLHGGSIVCENGVYRALHPDRACAFVTWDDLCAFADWAGLRPMTELEFEKACRGPLDPQPMEYPWNTSSRDNLKRQLDPLRALTFSDGFTEAHMTDANRDESGASYYGVLDLAGNVWERCITVGDSVGRAFTGSHGDGNLGAQASATNADWPKGTTEVLGFGYRGGAYYGTDEPHGNTNPYSPIGYRTFAGWGGAHRYKTYSARFVRTMQ